MEKNVAEIISVSKNVYDKGLVSGKSGNISAKFGNVIGITGKFLKKSESKGCRNL